MPSSAVAHGNGPRLLFLPVCGWTPAGVVRRDARNARRVRGRPRVAGTRQARMCAGQVEAPRLRPVGADGCSAAEIAGISSRVANWLNEEYPEESLLEAHARIGDVASRMYAEIRQGGEDDVGAVLLDLGGRLEREDFDELFVGPWIVANKVAEFVIAGAGAFSTARPPEHVNDRFERYAFLQKMLDGETPKEVVNGAIALVAGFKVHKFGWDGTEVQDAHFRQFGNVPPDVLGNEKAAEWTDSLKYLHNQLGIGAEEDASGKRAESLNTIIEAMHGFEMCKIQRADPEDHQFEKREVVAKWLHLNDF